MNVHISVDLGVASARVMKELGQPMKDLEADFNEINQTLASLVEEVQNELSAIWPFLRGILKLLPGNSKMQLVNFSMEIAREGAWKFANEIHGLEGQAYQDAVAKRDGKVAKISQNLLSPPWWIKMPLLGVKLTEWGNVKSQIMVLNGEKGWNPELIRRKRKPKPKPEA